MVVPPLHSVILSVLSFALVSSHDTVNRTAGSKYPPCTIQSHSANRVVVVENGFVSATMSTLDGAIAITDLRAGNGSFEGSSPLLAKPIRIFAHIKIGELPIPIAATPSAIFIIKRTEEHIVIESRGKLDTHTAGTRHAMVLLREGEKGGSPSVGE